MSDATSLAKATYDLACRLYGVTAKFSTAERPSLGVQIRETALDLTTRATDAVTTDDPAERQEMLRLAAVDTIRFDVLLRLGADLGEIDKGEAGKLADTVSAIADAVAKERRTVRRVAPT